MCKTVYTPVTREWRWAVLAICFQLYSGKFPLVFVSKRDKESQRRDVYYCTSKRSNTAKLGPHGKWCRETKPYKVHGAPTVQNVADGKNDYSYIVQLVIHFGINTSYLLSSLQVLKWRHGLLFENFVGYNIFINSLHMWALTLKSMNTGFKLTTCRNWSDTPIYF